MTFLLAQVVCRSVREHNVAVKWVVDPDSCIQVEWSWACQSLRRVGVVGGCCQDGWL